MSVLDTIKGAVASMKDRLTASARAAEPPALATSTTNVSAALVGKDIGNKPGPEEQVPITQEERDALYWLREVYLLEDAWAYRHDLLRIFRGEEYWANMMYQAGEANSSWLSATVSDAGTLNGPSDADDEKRRSSEAIYSLPNYRAYGLSFLAVVAARLPGARFTALNPEKTDDAGAARAASLVGELFRRNNPLQQILAEAARAFWIGGRVYGYVRHRKDAQRFGFTLRPTIEIVTKELPGEPAKRVCPNCGMSSPPDAQACATCARPLPEDSFVPAGPPRPVPVPIQTGDERVPNGAEVMDAYTGMHVRTPPNAKDIFDFGYLHLSREVDVGQIRAGYGLDVATQTATTGVGGGVTEQQRRMRLITESRTGGVPGEGYTAPWDPSNGKVTLESTWLRPFTFFRPDLPGGDRIRESLLARFPDGVQFDSIGNTVIGEPRPEAMEDHWVVMHAHPGRGQYRESVGDAMLDAQDAFNDLLSLAIDCTRHSTPKAIVNREILSADAINESQARGWDVIQANPPRNGMSLRESMAELPQGAVSGQHLQLQDMLSTTAPQFLTGVLPAVIGQGSDDLKTAHGFEMARDQALGRIGTPYRALKEFIVEATGLAVVNFAKAREDDALVSSGDVAKLIRLADVKGGQYRVSPESDDGYPVTPQDIRDVLLGYQANPQMAPAFFDPSNYAVTKQALGPNKFKFPGEADHDQQRREIDRLLREEPQPILDPNGMPIPDPMTGQPAMRSSIPIDPVFDNSGAHWTCIQGWMASEEGDEAKRLNPMGFMNVRLHGLEHHQAMQAMAAGIAPPGAPPPPTPPLGPGGPLPPESAPPLGAPDGALGPNQEGAPSASPTGPPPGGNIP